MARSLVVRRTRRCLLAAGMALAALAGGPAAAQPGMRVVYDKVETVTNTASGSPEGKVTRSTLTVRLAPAALAVRDGDAEQVFDFRSARALLLDHAGRTASELSLYALPAFRERELENRRALARMLAVMDRAPDLADAEAELGMRMDPPARAKVKERRRDGARVFSVNDRQVTSFVAAERTVPPELVAAVSRLYLYGAALHPLVRAELLKEPRLPSRLEFSWQLVQERTTVAWTLREIADEPFDARAARAPYPSKPLRDEGVVALACRVRAGEAGTPPAAASYLERAERLLGEGRGFEAFLVAFESRLAGAEAPDALLRRCGDAARGDARMQALARSMELEAKDPKGALALLLPLEADGLEGGEVLHVLRANQHLRVGDGDAALKAFTRALAASPFLLGAWMDAGQLFADGYDTPSAWTCWDAARAIAPGHPMLKRVDELEASLRRRRPEYF
ncbi:hypothetical protein [Anaeromyxobacter dehalogenans]|uniref:Tetratricopeptide repeat protein n=1 Tax=Anaeromyxobacter dehalogenans (strain 2CP-C) TaxID=290397 RepID=Q2IPQ2_ANADE|nr:hypothetical protein [Anaeromyxobacter dehalogenans]ABC80784.1 hypothetical protein Adeh_1009 [Anaeromyxobacter dehalogenans 2CP-C]